MYKVVNAFLVLSVLVLFNTGAAKADPLSYSHLDIDYAVDATAEFQGGTYDSDDTWGYGGSINVWDDFYAFSNARQGMFDLDKHSDLRLNTFTLGTGWHPTVMEEDDYKVNYYLAVSYEYIDSNLEADDHGRNPIIKSGLGLKMGFQAAVTKHLELNAGLYELSYGHDLFARKGGLDGLHFEIGAVYQITPDVDLTLTYFTGELDYADLKGLSDPDQVEVDREEIRFGIRYNFCI